MDYIAFTFILQKTKRIMQSGQQKSRGFQGELIIEVPNPALTQSQQLPLVQSLYITRLGFYPKALHHYYQRPTGISQAILLYCTDGRGWIQVKKNKIGIEAGQVYIIPAGTPHSYGADSSQPWTIYWFHFGGSNCNNAVKMLSGGEEKLLKGLQVGFSETRNALFKDMTATFLKGYSSTNLLYANLLLRHYLATFVAPDYLQPETLAAPVAGPTEKAIAFMQQHLSEPVTLHNIARAAHLSPSFFCRKFKQDTGYAPVAYFNHLRIQKACQLLHFTQLRINEVAANIGIEDPFYFSRLFRQLMGVSPGVYRKNEAL